MQDSDLKKLLLETCPVLPGQEARAWEAFRQRTQAGTSAALKRGWFLSPAFATVTVALICVANFVFTSEKHASMATADSEAPGIYATTFYSDSAQAQVVWLNGMEPATGKPTYLDPTTVIASNPADDPTSL